MTSTVDTDGNFTFNASEACCACDGGCDCDPQDVVNCCCTNDKSDICKIPACWSSDYGYDEYYFEDFCRSDDVPNTRCYDLDAAFEFQGDTPPRDSNGHTCAWYDRTQFYDNYDYGFNDCCGDFDTTAFNATELCRACNEGSEGERCKQEDDSYCFPYENWNVVVQDGNNFSVECCENNDNDGTLLDMKDNNCSWYEIAGNDVYCGRNDGGGFIANDICCACTTSGPPCDCDPTDTKNCCCPNGATDLCDVPACWTDEFFGANYYEQNCQTCWDVDTDWFNLDGDECSYFPSGLTVTDSR